MRRAAIAIALLCSVIPVTAQSQTRTGDAVTFRVGLRAPIELTGRAAGRVTDEKFGAAYVYVYIATCLRTSP